MNILFQLTGSIACYKACHTISQLVQAEHEVQVSCTPEALNFVGKATLEGLTSKPVFTNVFEESKMMDHIHLAKWAQLMIICPATANAINKLASGFADDVVLNLALSYDLKNKPYIIVPAMNQQMWSHPATQNSVSVLKSWGVHFWGPTSGHQACGDKGPGRMMEPQEIFERIIELTLPIANPKSKGLI